MRLKNFIDDLLTQKMKEMYTNKPHRSIFSVILEKLKGLFY